DGRSQEPLRKAGDRPRKGRARAHDRDGAAGAASTAVAARHSSAKAERAGGPSRSPLHVRPRRVLAARRDERREDRRGGDRASRGLDSEPAHRGRTMSLGAAILPDGLPDPSMPVPDAVQITEALHQPTMYALNYQFASKDNDFPLLSDSHLEPEKEIAVMV